MDGSGPMAGLTAESVSVGCGTRAFIAFCPYISRTMSLPGWEQQMSITPPTGGREVPMSG